MTDNRTQPYQLRESGVYCQPDVIEPPIGQNPDNSRLAVHHLARLISVEVFNREGSWNGRSSTTDDGRHERGTATVVPVWAVSWPGAGDTMDGAEAQHQENVRTFVVDANQPENKVFAAQFPDLFPTGSFNIVGPDSDGLEQSSNHAMIFLLNGYRWEVDEVMLWDEARNEETDTESGVYQVTARKYKDRSHERDAQRGLPNRVETPGIQDDVYDGWKA